MDSMDYLDEELRKVEKEQGETLLPLIRKKAKELGSEYFEDFTIPVMTSVEEAWEYRYLYVPILYKLGMATEASDLAQATFEYLFPQLHMAVKDRVETLLGKNYLKRAHQCIQEYLRAHDQIALVSYRLKSTQSIWKKVSSLRALEKMTSKEFATEVNDFIGIRWEMKVFSEENRYDALIQGIRLAPLKNLKTFRNQQLPQKSGFASEPVMKLCYVIDGLPIELQLLGGNITAYMCAKGYTDYKTKLSLLPEGDELYRQRRLQMAVESSPMVFRRYMLEELIGNSPTYSEFEPFVLDPLPEQEENKALCFPRSLIPICKLSNLIFEEDF